MLYEFGRWISSDRVELRLQVNIQSDIKQIAAELVRTRSDWRIEQKEYPREICRPNQSARVTSNLSLRDERADLADANAAVVRVGNTLRIRLNSGETLIFTDGDCGDFCNYRYVHPFDVASVEVLSRFREGLGRTFILVDRRTGAKAEVAEIPDFATDFSTFAVLDGSVIEIWNLSRKGFARQAHFEDAARYCFAGWNGFEQLMIGARLPGDPVIAEGTITRHDNGTWVKATGTFADGIVPALDSRLDRGKQSVCKRHSEPEGSTSDEYEAACIERLAGLAIIDGGSLVLSLADGRRLTSARAVQNCPEGASLPCNAKLVDFDAMTDSFLIEQRVGDRQAFTVNRRSGAVSTIQAPSAGPTMTQKQVLPDHVGR